MATKEELYDRAVDEVAEGNLEAAVEAYRQALEIDPDYADVLEGLSMALADLGRFDEAIEAARRVVELVPDDQLSYTNLSRIYQRAGDVPRAEEWAAKGRVLEWKQQLRTEAAELTSTADAHRSGRAAHGGEHKTKKKTSGG